MRRFLDEMAFFARIGLLTLRAKFRDAREEMRDFVLEALDCLYLLVPFLIAVVVSKVEEILDMFFGAE
jgi:hypothetical protein